MFAEETLAVVESLFPRVCAGGCRNRRDLIGPQDRSQLERSKLWDRTRSGRSFIQNQSFPSTIWRRDEPDTGLQFVNGLPLQTRQAGLKLLAWGTPGGFQLQLRSYPGSSLVTLVVRLLFSPKATMDALPSSSIYGLAVFLGAGP